MAIDEISNFDIEYEKEFDRIAKRSRIYIDLYYKEKGSRTPGKWFDEYALYLKNIELAFESSLLAPEDDNSKNAFLGLRPMDEKTSIESYYEAKEEEEELRKRFSKEEDTKTVITRFLSKHKNLTDQLGPSFIELLLNYMEEKGLSDPELYHLAAVDRRVFNSIINNKKKPNRNTVVCLALALHLNIDETNSLLRSANHPTIEKNVSLSDAIIGFCIEDKIYSIHVVDLLLDQYNEKTLVNYEGYKMKYFVSVSKGSTEQLELIVSQICATAEFNKLIFRNSENAEITLEDAIDLFKSGKTIKIVYRSKDKAKEFYKYLKNNKCEVKIDF